MTTIILHGSLRDLWPHPIKVFANSAAEAIQSLALIPALVRKDGKKHSVRVENFESKDALYDKREIDVLHIHPVVQGAGGNSTGAWVQIVIGIVMIAVAIFAPYMLPAMMSAGNVALAGAMLVLGGVMQLLAPQPSINASNEEKSRYLGNGRNTVGIGTRIPIILGRRKAYGHYISFDIDASIFDSAPAAWYSSPFTNMGELTHSAAPADMPINDPATAYKQPTSTFTGLSYPADMTSDITTYFNFVAVPLVIGDYDLSFATGQIFRVRVETGGPAVTKATILGGEIISLPAPGTSIVFTQNYV